MNILSKAAKRKAARQQRQKENRLIKAYKRVLNHFKKIEQRATRKANKGFVLFYEKVIVNNEINNVFFNYPLLPNESQNEQLLEFYKMCLEMLGWTWDSIKTVACGLYDVYNNVCERLQSIGKPLVTFGFLRPQIKKELVKRINFLISRPNYDITKFNLI